MTTFKVCCLPLACKVFIFNAAVQTGLSGHPCSMRKEIWNLTYYIARCWFTPTNDIILVFQTFTLPQVFKPNTEACRALPKAFVKQQVCQDYWVFWSANEIIHINIFSSVPGCTWHTIIASLSEGYSVVFIKPLRTTLL